MTYPIISFAQRDYLDCTIKRRAKFKEDKKQKFYVNFVLKLPSKTDIDREIVKFETKKDWISTKLSLNNVGQLNWMIKENKYPEPHPLLKVKLENFELNKPFKIKKELSRKVDSSKKIKYKLSCY